MDYQVFISHGPMAVKLLREELQGTFAGMKAPHMGQHPPRNPVQPASAIDR